MSYCETNSMIDKAVIFSPGISPSSTVLLCLSIAHLIIRFILFLYLHRTVDTTEVTTE